MRIVRLCGSLTVGWLFALTMYSDSVIAGVLPEFVGENCALETPPDMAGEMPVHSAHFAFARVYPRLVAIGVGYTGCQIVWEPQSVGRWEIDSILYIKSGSPETLWVRGLPG